MMWSALSRSRLLSLVIVIIVTCMSGTAKADFTFGEPVNLGPMVNTAATEYGPETSSDGLRLYFSSSRPGGYGDVDLWVVSRPSVDADWGLASNLGPTVNSGAYESCPSISADDLWLFFESERPGGIGGNDIWVASRSTPEGDWGAPVNLGPTVNSSVWDSCPNISDDGLSLHFSSFRSGGHGGVDVWVVTRASIEDAWGAPVNLGANVNTSGPDYHPGVSADELVLLFFSSRPGSWGDDLYMATRASTLDPWGEAANLGPMVNSGSREFAAAVSFDGRTLYFSSNRPGGLGGGDIWQAPIIPIVDFNGDGNVDGFEFFALAANWGTDDALCDIGPMPWGDGIVNEMDLVILAEHIGRNGVDPSLIAHWMLDEAEGDIACDSSFENDAVVLGGAAWQPGAGIMAGALEFDGVDDCIETPHIAGLQQGPFSVFAWVKGGGAGQVIISVANDSDWLLGSMAGRTGVGGKLATTFGGTTLTSETPIADGQWHRLGLVYDGASRTLYVDGTSVAEDDAADTRPSTLRINIGCGVDKTPGSFFAGLIDDVRIYNRVVRP